MFGAISNMLVLQCSFDVLFLILLGVVAAKTGGFSPTKAVVRIIFWGTLAMGITALIGYWFDVAGV